MIKVTMIIEGGSCAKKAKIGVDVQAHKDNPPTKVERAAWQQIKNVLGLSEPEKGSAK